VVASGSHQRCYSTLFFLGRPRPRFAGVSPVGADAFGGALGVFGVLRGLGAFQALGALGTGEVFEGFEVLLGP